MSQQWRWPGDEWNRKSEEEGDRWFCSVSCWFGTQEGGPEVGHALML